MVGIRTKNRARKLDHIRNVFNNCLELMLMEKRCIDNINLTRYKKIDIEVLKILEESKTSINQVNGQKELLVND